MPDDGGLRLQLADSVDVMVGDLLDFLVRKDLRITFRLFDGLRVVGPAWRERGEAILLEQRSPAVPAAREEPEAVNEDDRLPPRVVRPIERFLLVGRETRHFILLIG